MFFLKSLQFLTHVHFVAEVTGAEEAFHILHADFFVDSHSTSRLIGLILATGTESRRLPTIGNGRNIREEGTRCSSRGNVRAGKGGWLRDRTQRERRIKGKKERGWKKRENGGGKETREEVRYRKNWNCQRVGSMYIFEGCALDNGIFGGHSPLLLGCWQNRMKSGRLVRAPM